MRLRVTLDVDVSPWSAEEMAAEADLHGFDLTDGFDGESEMPSPHELAELIVGSLEQEEVVQEMFAGSNIYLHFQNPRVASSELSAS